MSDKTVAYVCTGCGIGEHLDTARLAAVAAERLGEDAQIRPPMCLPEGVERLRADLHEAGASRCVIAACSSRVNQDVFSADVLDLEHVGRVNIRELVAWSTPPGDEDAQMAAEDYLRMGIESTLGSTTPAARPRDVATTVLVVGGGVTGMTAALEAAAAGHDVVLVERSAALGGWTARFRSTFPTRAPYEDLQPVEVEDLIARVSNDLRITALSSATIESVSGEPGSFVARVARDGTSEEVAAGAVVLATGWRPREDPALSRLGRGTVGDVITGVELEEMALSGRIARPSDGRGPARVAIVMRPSAASEHAFAYGANVADMSSLKHALYVRELVPDASVYVLYEDIVTPGLYEAFYRRVQQEPGVYFTKGAVSGVDAGEGGTILLTLERSLLGEHVTLAADLVVLATEMEPTTADDPVLNLLYKQGPGLPTAKFGFSDSNFICFPYETGRTGLYAAGSVREPMDIALSAEDATGAALKAIQSIELIRTGRATHPRTGDLSLPETRLQGCTQCGRCSEECPFSAIEVDERGFPSLNPDRCRRCGICMGACPVRVISFEDYSVEMLTAMVQAIRFPEDETHPRILALACENDAYPAFDLAGINRLRIDASVRVIPLRCLGSLNVAVVADALSHGIDGIMLMGCRSGEDYQCHFMQGSALAAKRMDNVKETLTRLMMEPERVKPVELEISEYDRLPALVGEFVEEVRAMGPNPYKGF